MKNWCTNNHWNWSLEMQLPSKRDYIWSDGKSNKNQLGYGGCSNVYFRSKNISLEDLEDKRDSFIERSYTSNKTLRRTASTAVCQNQFCLLRPIVQEEGWFLYFEIRKITNLLKKMTRAIFCSLTVEQIFFRCLQQHFQNLWKEWHTMNLVLSFLFCSKYSPEVVSEISQQKAKCHQCGKKVFNLSSFNRLISARSIVWDLGVWCAILMSVIYVHPDLLTKPTTYLCDSHFCTQDLL